MQAEWLQAAQHALLTEADALRLAAERLGTNLVQAVELILTRRSKVIVTGIGKSGHIGQKITATLCSTGTPAVFLHAAEAVHGDLGVYTPGDCTLLISKSGTTAELIRLVPILRELNSPLIGILGNLEAPLTRQVNIVLDARVAHEADHLNLAPTCSTTVALGLGDALAVALMHARRFSEVDFARYHPAGQLGRNLLLHVADVMHTGNTIAWASLDDPVRLVVIAMTRYALGAACVVDEADKLLGIITDGDLRRALQTHDDIRPLRAVHIMTPKPITISPQASLQDAVRLMEDRPSQLSVLPVVDETQRCLGLLRIHDIYQAALR